MIRIDLNIDDASDALQRIRGNVQDSKNMLSKIVTHEEKLLKNRFKSETSPNNSKWTDSYRKQVEGGKTLTDSGNLYGSIGSYATTDKAGFGTATPLYERTHQYGAVIRPVKAPALAFRLADGRFIKTQKSVIPRRQFLPEKSKELDVPTWLDIIESSILDG